MMRIHVAILAAGQSLRYGSEDKLSEQVGGKSLLTILLEKIQRISAPWKGCTVLVVSRELAKLCTDGPEICVVNGDPKRGISHSIQLALDVVQNSPHWMPGDAVCFCVCDQPFLKQGTLENMLEGYLKSGKGIGCIEPHGGVGAGACKYLADKGERAFHAGQGSGSDCRLYARDRARRFQPSSLVPDGES